MKCMPWLVLLIVANAAVVSADEATWEGLLRAAGQAKSANDLEKAESLLQKAAEEAVSSFDASDRRVATTWNDLAVASFRRRNFESAVASLEKAIAGFQRSNPQDPTHAIALRNLAEAQNALKRPAEALAAARAALAQDEARLGQNHAELCVSLRLIANLTRQTDPGAAEPALIRIREIQRAASPDSLTLADALDQLGLFYEGLNRDKEGTPLFEEALKIRRGKLHEFHPEMLNSLYRLGDNLRLAKDLSRAEQVLTEADQLGQRRFGPDAPDFVGVLEKQLLVLTALGADDKRQQLSVRIDRLKKIARWNVMLQKAQVLRSEGQLADARQACEALLKDAAEFGAEGQCMANLHAELGEVAFTANDLAQARTSFDRSLTLNRKILGENHPLVARNWLTLGVVALKQDDGPAGEAALQQALKSNRASGRIDVEAHQVALEILGGISSKQGRHAEAVAYREELVLLRKELGRPLDVQAANTWNALGINYLATGQLANARTSFLEARAIYSQLLPQDHAIFKSLAENLARASVGLPAPGEVVPIGASPPASSPGSAASTDPGDGAARAFSSLSVLLITAVYLGVVARRRGYSGLAWASTCMVAFNPVLLFSLLAVLPNRKRQSYRARERAVLADQLAQASTRGTVGSHAVRDYSVGDQKTVQ